MIQEIKDFIDNIWKESDGYKVYEIVKDFYTEGCVDAQVPYNYVERNYTQLSNYTVESWEEYMKNPSTVATIKNTIKRHIDIAGNAIYVYFPHVTITNEFDESTNVDNLYVRFYVTLSGKLDGRFGILRSTFTPTQLRLGYIHSHCPHLSASYIEEFQDPCTGSGPINNTISYLNVDFDEERWKLFCYELKLYIGTESISGGPYIRLANLTSNPLSCSIEQSTYYNNHYMDFRGLPIDDFIDNLIKDKVVKFSYVNNHFILGMSTKDCILKISNYFIDWINKKIENGLSCSLESLKERNILKECALSNNALYYVYSGTNTISSFTEREGTPLFVFKGNDVCFHIVHTTEPEENSILILDPTGIYKMVDKMLKILNYKYGKTDTANTYFII